MSSQWALVIRNDGETSVVPLRDVSALQHDEAVIGDKNPTIIVLQTQEQVRLYRLTINIPVPSVFRHEFQSAISN